MIGRTISHYKILEKLGEGGMGVVYKAEDTKLKRTVALKFLPPEFTRDPQAKERFVREAQAASALEHNNICNIHEIVQTKDGQMFIVMACYEGESLRQKIDRGPLELEEAIDVVMQAAQGLAKAHEREIVHRDVKPANLLMTNDGVVKIVDFGLAKLSGGTRLTKEGTTAGTVAYMSPEQTRGEDVDHRTDIWSLGVVLYEMLTGQQPFKGDHEQAVVYSIVNEIPDPPTGLRTGVPMELERVVNKCLEKKPAERFQTAVDLIADLRRVKREAPTPSLGRPEAKRPVLRRPALWLSLSALILIVITAIWILPRFLAESGETPTADRKMLVVLPFENLGSPEDEYFADGITEEITSRLAMLHGLGVISRTSAFHYKDTKKTISQIGEELGVAYVLEGTVRWNRGSGDETRVRVTPQLIRVSDDTHIWSDRYDRVLQDIFQVQTDIAETVIRQLDITLLEPERKALESRPTENMDAYQAYLRGLGYASILDPSIDNLHLALQMFERAVELDPGFALAFAKLSEAHSDAYRIAFEPEVGHLREARIAIDRALELQPGLPEAHLALGYYHYVQSQYEEALEAYSTAGKHLPNDSRIPHYIGSVLRRQGKMEAALEDFKRAFELDPRDPNLALAIGNTYFAVQKYDEAELYTDKSILLDPNSVTAYGLKSLIDLMGRGDIKRSRANLEMMPKREDIFNFVFVWFLQELYERDYQAALNRLIASSHEFAAFDIVSLMPKPILEGFLYRRLNKPELAHESFETVRIQLEKGIAERPENIQTHCSLGLVYAYLGQKEEAIRVATRIVDMTPISRDMLVGVGHISSVAQIYTVTGEYDAALEQIEYLLSLPGWFSVNMLRLNPRWDPLRDHPRYQRLLDEYSGGGS